MNQLFNFLSYSKPYFINFSVLKSVSLVSFSLLPGGEKNSLLSLFLFQVFDSSRKEFQLRGLLLKLVKGAMHEAKTKAGSTDLTKMKTIEYSTPNIHYLVY